MTEDAEADRKIRMLISGFGLMGSQHARLVHENDDCVLAAVIVPNSERYRVEVEGYGAALYDDIGQAIEEQDIGAAIISSPNEFHFEQARACIERGVPVLVEKPLTDNLEDAGALVDLACEHTVPILVGHHRTYSSLLEAARAFLGSTRFGNLVAVQGSALFYKPERYFEDGPWRTKPGGGPILINLIHEVGIMRHLCGEIRSVQAIESRHARGFEVEDTVSINLEFEEGAIGCFLLSDATASDKSWEMTSGENPVYPHYPADDCYHFAGTNGSLDFPSMAVRYYADPDNASWWNEFTDERIRFAPADPLVRQLEHFVDVVRGSCDPLVAVDDGYRNMLVIEAIRRSIREGCRVMIDAVLATG